MLEKYKKFSHVQLTKLSKQLHILLYMLHILSFIPHGSLSWETKKTTTINPRKVMSVETVAGYVKVHLFIL